MNAAMHKHVLIVMTSTQLSGLRCLLKCRNQGAAGLMLSHMTHFGRGWVMHGELMKQFKCFESVELGTAVGNPQLSEALISGLLNALIESGDLRRANGLLARYCHVLQEGGKPSILSFNLLIKGYISVGCPQAAIGIHDKKLRRGLNPDRIT